MYMYNLNIKKERNFNLQIIFEVRTSLETIRKHKNILWDFHLLPYEAIFATI